MPGNVLHAAPVTAIPLWLCKSFVHERAYPQNEYKNGVDIRTPDIGGAARTSDFAKEVAMRMR